MNATELKTEEQNGVPHHKVASIVALTVVGAIVICGVVATVTHFYGREKTVASISEPDSRYYPQAGWVSEIEPSEDIVTVTWFNGNQFQFYGVEDWEQGDICAMIMDTNGTPNNLRDDSIVAVRYCGDQHVDLSKVADCKKTADGIQFFMQDGTGYYWQR